MHKSVLLKEAVDLLGLAPGETFLDGTFGAGGHSREVNRRFGESVKIIALDQDPTAAKVLTDKPENLEFHTLNFRHLDQALEGRQVDAVLFDLGFSSDQLESSGRGFSFLRNEPLDMRMSGTGFTARDIVNSWDENALEVILRGFGEEPFSKKIARAIAVERDARSIETTFDLVAVIESVKPKKPRDKIHPATKTFQALRIAVNEELTSLEEGLEKGFQALNPHGRMAVISFHSLEDRIVKNFFREKAREGEAAVLTKRPLTASEAEKRENPRSRSAKLRAIEKLAS